MFLYLSSGGRRIEWSHEELERLWLRSLALRPSVVGGRRRVALEDSYCATDAARSLCHSATRRQSAQCARRSGCSCCSRSTGPPPPRCCSRCIRWRWCVSGASAAGGAPGGAPGRAASARLPRPPPPRLPRPATSPSGSRPSCTIHSGTRFHSGFWLPIRVHRRGS